MASGRTHDIINLTVFPIAVYYLKPEDFTGFFVGYMIGTFFISPDNDIFHSKPNKRWKKLQFIWKPYTKLFSHRGISHFPFLGLTTKLLYIAFLLFILFSIVYISLFLSGIYTSSITDIIDKKTLIYYIQTPFFISFLFGLFLSEIVHILTDIVTNFRKHLYKLYQKII